jgi:hypothetical protein
MANFVEFEYGQIVDLDQIIAVSFSERVLYFQNPGWRFEDKPTLSVDILLRHAKAYTLYFSGVASLDAFYGKVQAKNKEADLVAEKTPVPPPMPVTKYSIHSTDNQRRPAPAPPRKGAATKDTVMDDDDWGQKGI